MEKWALILLLRIEREKLRASRLAPPHKERFLNELSDMILLLKGKVTMADFALLYPESEYESRDQSGE